MMIRHPLTFFMLKFLSLTVLLGISFAVLLVHIVKEVVILLKLYLLQQVRCYRFTSAQMKGLL